MDKQSLLGYRTTLLEIKKTYESRVVNGAAVHEFKNRLAKADNEICLALREIEKHGRVDKDRGQRIKRYVHDLARFVGTL